MRSLNHLFAIICPFAVLAIMAPPLTVEARSLSDGTELEDKGVETGSPRPEAGKAMQADEAKSLEADIMREQEAPQASSGLTRHGPRDDLVRKFADHLLEQGDAYRAIGEYKRYLFLSPGADDEDLVYYRIALAYLVGRQAVAALPLFEQVAGDPAARPEVRHAAWAATGKAFFNQDRCDDAALHLGSPPANLDDRNILSWAAYTRGHCYLKAFELEEAARAFSSVCSETVWSKPAAALENELSSPPRFSRRSPTLAGILSLVPGLGHLYLGMWPTAFAAATWNGAFLWAMYETGRSGHWGLFSLLALLEWVWYSGTIYGAVAGAFRHNRDARLNYLDSLEAAHPGPGAPPQPTLPDTRQLDLFGLGSF